MGAPAPRGRCTRLPPASGRQLNVREHGREAWAFQRRVDLALEGAWWWCGESSWRAGVACDGLWVARRVGYSMAISSDRLGA
eukprot:366086-Chlamydomonas_euryale.AAC.4